LISQRLVRGAYSFSVTSKYLDKVICILGDLESIPYLLEDNVMFTAVLTFPSKVAVLCQALCSRIMRIGG
jgi:hypothetical protein